MAEQPIKSTDIIENGLFSDAVKSADQFLTKAKEVETQLKANLAVSREFLQGSKLNNSKDLQANAIATSEATTNLLKLQKVQEESLKVEKLKLTLQKEAEKVEQERIKTSQQAAKAEAQYNKEIEKTNKQLKDSASEYKQASNALNTLSKRVKDNSIAGRELSKTGRLVAVEFANLKAKIDKADHSAEDFRRNVGNYPKQLKELQRELQNLEPGTEQFNKLAAKAGALKDKIQDAKDATKAFATESKATQAKNLFSQIGNDISDLDFSGAAEKAGQFAAVMRTITLGEVVGGVKAFGTAIIDMGKALIASPIGLFAVAVASIIGAFKLYRDTINEAAKAQSDLNQQVRESNLLLEQGRIAYQKSANETLLLQGKIGKKEKEIRDITLDSKAKQAEAANKYQDEIKKLLEDEEINEFMRKKKLGKLNYDFAIATFNESRKLRQDIKNIGLQADKEEAEKRKEEQQKRIKEIRDNNKEIQNELDRIRIENTQLSEVREVESAKLDNKIAIDKVKESVANERLKNMLIAELEIQLRQQLIVIREKYAKEAKDKEAKEAEDKLKAEQEADKKFIDNAQKQADNLQRIADENKDKEAKKQAKRKAEQEKELKEVLAFSNQVIDLIAKEEAAKSELRQQGFDKQISDQDKNIETQRRLAEKGLKNTLAEEEARKIQLEAQKEEEKQREIKRQKALAFFKLFAAYAEKDPNTALQKALRDAVLAEAVAGAFFTGTEKVEDDLKGNKVHNGRDGYRIAVDGSERILTGDQNKMVGDISNEALAKLAYDYNNGVLDTVKYTAIPSADFAKNVYESQQLAEIIALRKEIQGVKQAIEEKPVSNYSFTGYEFIKETIENNHKTTIRHQLKRPRL